MAESVTIFESVADRPRYDCRNAYVETLAELAQENHRIVGVVNDSVGSSKLDAFKKAFPDRLINVGIAEQDMVGVAAGLANGGRIAFVSAAACFLTGRALEQIKADVAYSNRNVKLCGMSPGMAYGELGPTHHSIEDIAWLRAIDNITIVVPADPTETAAALRWAAEVDGPVFVRVSRMAVPEVNREDYTFSPGKAVLLREGSDVTLISNGTVLWRALVAAEQLDRDGISARVLSMPTVKPLDADAVLAAARETSGIVTAEEATTAGALGGAVAETIVQNHPTRMKILGVPEFAPTGSAGYLLDRYGMSPDGIADAARSLIEVARGQFSGMRPATAPKAV
jgi:transketolase